MTGDREAGEAKGGPWSGPTPRRNLHGRRHGRPLRPGRRRLLEELLPKIRLELPPEGARLDPAALFGAGAREVWLEIGFGSGEHLAWQAEHHPEVGFLGAEPYVNGVASLLRHVSDRDLANLRVLQGDGRALLDALPEASLSRAFVLFPDPWPKVRHHKRRLIRRGTLDRLAACLKDGAELRIATDHGDYLAWILERATAHPDLRWLAEGPGDWHRRPDDWPATRYEEKAVAEGRIPVYLRFRRRPR